MDDMDDWDFLYLPYPVMLSSENAAKIKSWVKKGGTLVSEGCPAYWGDKAHVGEVQPNQGLDELFGCKENYVEFTPDILDDTEMTVKGAFTWGYTAHDGDGCGQFYEELMAFGGKKPRFTVSDKRVRARLHSGDGGDYLWIANARKGVDIPVIIEAGRGDMKSVSSLKGPAGEIRDGKLHLIVPARDVVVLKINF